MKHYIILLSLASIAVLNGCKDKEKEESNSQPDSLEVIVGEVEVEEKASDLFFSESIISFLNKNNAECSAHIKEGTKAYKHETRLATGESKAMTETGLVALEALDKKITKGEVKDVSVLENTFLQAERAVVHTIIVKEEEIVVPMDSTSTSASTLSNALSHLKNLVGKEKGEAKKTGEKIVLKGDIIEAKIKNEGKVTAKELIDFYSSAKSWLATRN
jgi:hypothetical protein